MKTAIITGFRPFGAYKINPTEKAVKGLDNKFIQGHHIKSLVFNTQIFSLDAGYQAVNIAKKFRAKAIISLGISSAVRGIRIEKVCTNWVEHENYCTASENKKPLDACYPDKEALTVNLRQWNLEKIHDELQKNFIPFEKEISINAGNFCCNALMYRILSWRENLNYKIPFIFCHVPCTEESVAGITDFDRKGKILITDGQLTKTIEILLDSYESGK